MEMCGSCGKRLATIRAESVKRTVYVCDTCMRGVILLVEEAEPVMLYRANVPLLGKRRSGS